MTKQTLKTYVLRASQWPNTLFCMLTLKLQMKPRELLISVESEYFKTKLAMYCLLIKLTGLFWPRVLPGVIYTWNELHRHLQLQQSGLGNPDSPFQSSTPKRTSCALKHQVTGKKQRRQLAQTDGGYPVAGSRSRRLSTPHQAPLGSAAPARL